MRARTARTKYAIDLRVRNAIGNDYSELLFFLFGYLLFFVISKRSVFS